MSLVVEDDPDEYEPLELRWQMEGDLEWSSILSSDDGRFELDVGQRFGTLVTEVRSALPEGKSSEWACLPDYEISMPITGNAIVRTLTGVECPPDDVAGDVSWTNPDTGEVFTKNVTPIWTYGEPAALNSAISLVSASGHSLQINNDDTVTYSQGRNNFGVVWRSENMRLTEINNQFTLRNSNTVWQNMDRSLFRPGDYTAVQVSRLQWGNDNIVDQINFRLVIRAPGAFGAGAPGPHLIEPISNFFLVIQWGSEWFRCDFDPNDALEPYEVPTSGIPERLRRLIAAYTLSAEPTAPAGGVSAAMCHEPKWPFGDRYYQATRLIPLKDTVVAVRGDYDTESILAYKETSAASADFNEEGVGFYPNGDVYFSMLMPLPGSLFVGDPETVTLERLRLFDDSKVWVAYLSQSGGGEPRLKEDVGFYSLVFSINNAIAFARPTTTPNVAISFTGDDAFQLIGDDIRNAPRSLAGRNRFRVALVDRRNWGFAENTEEYQRAFLDDDATGEWVWGFTTVEDDDVSPVTVAGDTPKLLANLRMLVLDAQEQCVEGNELKDWQVDRNNAFTRRQADGLTREPLYTLCAESGEITQEEIPSRSVPYRAGISEGADVGIRVPDEEGRLWRSTEPETTAMFPVLGKIDRGVVGIPDVGASPTDDWTDWTEPTYQKTFGKDAVQIFLSAGQVDADIPDPIEGRSIVYPTTPYVEMHIAVVGGGEEWSETNQPVPITEVTVEGDILDYRGLDNFPPALTKVDSLVHPKDPAYKIAVELTAKALAIGTRARTYTRRVEVSFRLNGELVRGYVPITVVATREGEEPERPEAPVGVTVRNTTTTSATVRWLAPDNSADITNYEVETLNDSGSVLDKERVGSSARSLRVTGLRTGEYHHFKVYSLIVRNDGTVLRSLPATASAETEGTARARAGVPRNVNITGTSTTTYRLNWQAPTPRTGVTITGYTHKVRLGREDGRVIETNSLAASATRDSVSGLTQNQTYVSELIANSPQGNSDSVFVSTTTNAERGNAPQGLAAGLIDNAGNVEFTWRPPAYKQETPTTGYQLQTAANAAFTSGVTTRNLARTVRRETIGGFARATQYHARIRAESNGSYSSWATITFTTAAVKTPLPSLSIVSVRPYIRSLRPMVGALDSQADGWLIQWAAVGSDFTTQQQKQINTPTRNLLTTFLGGLTTGQEYKLRAAQLAYANNPSRTTGPWGPEFNATPRGSQKTALASISIASISATGRTINITSSALPTNAVGIAVRWKLSSDSSFITGDYAEFTQTTTSVSLTNETHRIRYNETYDVEILALAADSDPTYSDGEWSDSSEVTTERGALGALAFSSEEGFWLTYTGNDVYGHVARGDLPEGATGMEAQFSLSTAFTAVLATVTGSAAALQARLGEVAAGSDVHSRIRAISDNPRYAAEGAWAAALTANTQIDPDAPVPSLDGSTPGVLSISVTGVHADALGWSYEYTRNIDGVPLSDFRNSPEGWENVRGNARSATETVAPGSYKVQVRQLLPTTRDRFGRRRYARSPKVSAPVTVEVVARTTGTKLSTPNADNVGRIVKRTAGTQGQSGPSGQQAQTPTDRAWQVRASGNPVELPFAEPLTVRGENNEFEVNLPFPFSYQIRDHAVDENFRDSDWSAARTIEETEQAEPLTVQATGGDGVINWRNVSLPFGVTQWRRRIASAQADLEAAEVFTTSELSVTDMGLIPGVRFIQVQSVGEGNTVDGDWQDLPSVVVTALNVPATPVFSEVLFGANDIVVNWNAVANAENYSVFLHINGFNTPPQLVALNLPASARTHTFSGVSLSTTYYVSMWASNSNGQSGRALRSGTTLASVPTRPGRARSMSVSNIQETRVDIAWQPPAPVPGQTVTRWQLRLTAGAVVAFDEDVGLVTRKTVTGLTKNTRYQIRLTPYAGTNAGISLWRTVVTFDDAIGRFPAPAQGTPTGVSAGFVYTFPMAQTSIIRFRSGETERRTPDYWLLDYALSEGGSSELGYPARVDVGVVSRNISAPPGTTGWFRLAAGGNPADVEDSPYSDWHSAVSGVKLPTPLAAAIDIVLGSKEVEVGAINPPAALRNATYTFEVRSAATEAGLAAADVHSSAYNGYEGNPISLTGLTDGTTYHIEARYVSPTEIDSDWGGRKTFSPAAPLTGAAVTAVNVFDIRSARQNEGTSLYYDAARMNPLDAIMVFMRLTVTGTDRLFQMPRSLEFTANGRKYSTDVGPLSRRNIRGRIIEQPTGTYRVSAIHFLSELPDDFFVTETVEATLKIAQFAVVGQRIVNRLPSADQTVTFNIPVSTDWTRGPQTANVTSIDQITDRSARVNWTLLNNANTFAPLTSFEVEARRFGTVVARTSVTALSSRNAVVTGLDPETRYEFAVRTTSSVALYLGETTGTTIAATTTAPLMTIAADQEEVNIEDAAQTINFTGEWSAITPVEVNLYSRYPAQELWQLRDTSSSPTSPLRLRHIVPTTATVGSAEYRLGWKTTAGGNESFTDPIRVHIRKDFDVAITATNGRTLLLPGRTINVTGTASPIPDTIELQYRSPNIEQEGYYYRGATFAQRRALGYVTGAVSTSSLVLGRYFTRWRWRVNPTDDYSYSNVLVFDVVDLNELVREPLVLDKSSVAAGETVAVTVAFSNPSTIDRVELRLRPATGNIANILASPPRTPGASATSPVVLNLRVPVGTAAGNYLVEADYRVDNAFVSLSTPLTVTA